MQQTYEGVLRGEHIEWTGEEEPPLTSQPTRVSVTILGPVETMSDAERGRRMAEALERLAALPERNLPADPSEWQSEIRKDRPLPGRDD